MDEQERLKILEKYAVMAQQEIEERSKTGAQKYEDAIKRLEYLTKHPTTLKELSQAERELQEAEAQMKYEAEVSEGVTKEQKARRRAEKESEYSELFRKYDNAVKGSDMKLRARLEGELEVAYKEIEAAENQA